MRRFILAALGAAALASMGGAQPAVAVTKARPFAWFASWSASPMDAHSFPAAILAPTIDAVVDQTIRQTVTISHGGTQLRVRISNQFGTAALHIGAASVGYRAAGDAAPRRMALTFGGAPGATVAAGAPLVSDPVPLVVPNGARIEISLYLPDPTPITTIHVLGLEDCYVSAAGDFAMAESLPGATPFSMLEKMSGRSYFARPFVSEVDVAAAGPIRTIIAFGDSITDGQGSTANVDGRWPDDLARRIAGAGLRLSVVNQGIGGNQVTANGVAVSALGRFDQDVLALPGASTVILMEGINDIGFSAGLLPGLSRPDLITADEIIRGYRQLIARSHARGLRIVGATMTPFAGSPAFTPAKEGVRQAVNGWIRSSKAFDAVVDFDRVARDSIAPDRLAAAFDSGDHIHLNDAGYAAMAGAVDLKTL